jgi:peptidoglycan hydrolase CwlO-like protein
MNKIIIAMVVMIVIGAILGGIALMSNEVEPFNAPSIVEKLVEKEVTVEVNPLDAQIKEREAELEARYNEIKKVEAERDVLILDVAAKQERIQELNKTLAGFMTATTSKR